jgi:hypothetical protein
MVQVFIGREGLAQDEWSAEELGRHGFRDLEEAKKGIGPLAFLVILFFALLVATAGMSVSRVGLFRPVEVLNGYWSTSGVKVERVKLGELVTGHVTLQSLGKFEGEIVLRIRVDIRFWFDKDIVTQRLQVSLKPGEEKEFRLDFRPDRSSAGDMRGYFIEIDFGLIHGKWTMPSAYPPRLIVTT